MYVHPHSSSLSLSLLLSFSLSPSLSFSLTNSSSYSCPLSLLFSLVSLNFNTLLPKQKNLPYQSHSTPSRKAGHYTESTNPKPSPPPLSLSLSLLLSLPPSLPYYKKICLVNRTPLLAGRSVTTLKTQV